MTSRYGLRRTRANENPLYKRMMQDRGIKKINHYRSPRFAILSDEFVSNIDYQVVYWSSTSKFWKLASEYYGDPTLWWVVAYFNKMPTDFHPKVGDLIYIPTQWEVVYNALIEGDERYD
tara:strand:- start:1823 stop:2179 length:357 start_codon:yes stop_codon:yes gene_type:complete